MEDVKFKTNKTKTFTITKLKKKKFHKSFMYIIKIS